MNKKLSWLLLSTLLGGAVLTGCSEENPKPTNGEGDQNPTSKNPTELYYANMFGKEAMSTYYYWNKEISSDLDNWNIETNNDPIGTVDRIRYHQGDKYIDKWSMLTDDMASFNSSVEGVSTTFGWNLTFYLVEKETNQYVAVVNFVHEGTPAAKAGFKRGNIILSINDEKITPDNYTDLYYKPTLKVSLGELKENTIVSQNKSIELTAVNMYENPIICDSVYEFNGKKVGYLAYTGFDLKSINPLIEIGKKFKAEGIEELVLDLRYNGGGYVITENVLASMFAPQEAVSSKKVFEKEIYNSYLSEIYQKQGENLETRFTTEFNYPEVEVNASTKDANIGLKKIYGLIGSGSASASEALLGGLMPYTNVRLIGTQTHGKYCTGWMLSAEDMYEKCPQELKNWGIYVMVSIYQNADGKTPCMPDGLIPDIQIEDDPIQAYQIGDVNEPLLKQALMEAGRSYETNGVGSRSAASPHFKALPPVKTPLFGKRIQLIPSFVSSHSK